MCVCLYVGMYIDNNLSFYLHQRGREAMLGSTHNTERYSIHLKTYIIAYNCNKQNTVL